MVAPARAVSCSAHVSRSSSSSFLFVISDRYHLTSLPALMHSHLFLLCTPTVPFLTLALTVLHGFCHPCDVHLNVPIRNANTPLVNSLLRFRPRLYPHSLPHRMSGLSSVVMSFPPCLPPIAVASPPGYVSCPRRNSLIQPFHALTQISTIVPTCYTDLLTFLTFSMHLLGSFPEAWTTQGIH